MKHTRCPTFNNYIPTQPTLASQPSKTSILSHSPFSLSPVWSWGRPSLLMDHDLEAHDFQSNAKFKSNRRSDSGFEKSLTGLGIRYADATSLSTPNFDERADPFHVCVPSPQIRSFGTHHPNISHSVHMDSMFDVASVQDLSVEVPRPHPYVFEPELPMSWSSSSVSSAPKCTLDSAIMAALATTDDVNADLNLEYPPLDYPSSWSFDSLSAASGCSVNTIATQLSAVASELVQNIQSDLRSSWSQDMCTNEGSGSGAQTEALTNPDPVFLIISPDMVAPIADINMYDMTSPSQESSIGINPADIMAESFDSPFPPACSTTLHSFNSPDIPSLDPLNTMVAPEDDEQPFLPMVVDDAIVKQEHHLASSEDDALYHVFEFGYNDDYVQMSEYEPTPHLPNLPSPTSPSPIPSPRQGQTMSQSKKTSRNNCQKETVSGRVASIKVDVSPIKVEDDGPAFITETPVLDAHHGIELSELKARATKYRLRNPGEEIDNTWLLSFAGKLSARGEMLDEYRCYVVGCHQKNKRRDHIVVHVGGHLDRRPFKCLYWYVLTSVGQEVTDSLVP